MKINVCVYDNPATNLIDYKVDGKNNEYTIHINLETGRTIEDKVNSIEDLRSGLSNLITAYGTVLNLPIDSMVGYELLGKMRGQVFGQVDTIYLLLTQNSYDNIKASNPSLATKNVAIVNCSGTIDRFIPKEDEITQGTKSGR